MFYVLKQGFSQKSPNGFQRRKIITVVGIGKERFISRVTISFLFQAGTLLNDKEGILTKYAEAMGINYVCSRPTGKSGQQTFKV